MTMTMKKKLLFIAAVTLVIIGATVAKTYNMNKLTSSDLSFINIDALANSEESPCKNASHCTSEKLYSCFYYVITGDNNKITTELTNHIHNGVD